MRLTAPAGPWAVYRMTVLNKPSVNAMCLQSEWDAMELAKPGFHTLIRGGIASDSEAEKLARGTSGDAKCRQGAYPRSTGA
jgi:hypothetical protein